MREREPPEKMSELIRLAITDGQRLDREIYTPDAHTWHELFDDGFCGVCDAGAVMAGTLKAEPSNQIDAEFFGVEWGRALTALDAVREGAMVVAYARFTGKPMSEVRGKVKKIRGPEHGEFEDWPEYELHLDELDRVAQEFEDLGL